MPGFHPDPCLIRAGGVYYIAVSTFEWLPGVRVYESEDLANWEYCCDILTDQVKLAGNPKNCSIWAPQLSYYDGLFYLIYTDVKSTKRPFKDTHNYLITAEDIHGPWSPPVYLNSSGFDPSLFHDEDGRKWLLNVLWDYRLEEGNKSSGIVMQEYSPVQKRLIGKPMKLYDGTCLKKTEAPHIYKYSGWYYLLTAEGGTGSGHAVTVARSRELAGPYDTDPRNPMLTSRDHPELPLQCAGHGSLVETPEGQWYMAHLCTRPIEGMYAILGRETALQQVYWDEEGWLRLVSGGTVPEMEVVIQGVSKSPSPAVFRFEDRFDGSCLHPIWNTLRVLADEHWCSLSVRPGYLRLTAGESVQSLFRHHLLGFRQRDFHFRAETALEYEPEHYLQMAGLMLYLNEDNYLYAYISEETRIGRLDREYGEARKVLRLMKCEEGRFMLESEVIPVPTGVPVGIAVEGHEATAQFYYRYEDNLTWEPLFGTQFIGFLSGGFTGNYIAIAAHDMNSSQGSYADFAYFIYEQL